MTSNIRHSYFVVMIDYGKRGMEAVVDPELTRRDVVARIISGEYPRDKIVFVHHVESDGECDVITDEILSDADDERADSFQFGVGA